MLIYDASEHGRHTALGTEWRFAADTVMGGVSEGCLNLEAVRGRHALLLNGRVSLENNGGFIQMNADLSREGCFDASRFWGLRLEALGEGGPFTLLLKTEDNARPWQSYRVSISPGVDWTTLWVPLSSLHEHRTDVSFDARRVRRLGLAALGRAGPARLALARAAFVSDPG